MPKMDWLGLQLTSMLLFVFMCFTACVVPAMFAHRLQQGSVCSEVITYLNCVSGGVFAATFFIMYNHINEEFTILLSGAPIWQERFVLGAFVVFLGFLLTGLVEKLTDYIQQREASKNATFPASCGAAGTSLRTHDDAVHAAINQRHSRDAGSSARLIADDAEELSPLNSAVPDADATPAFHDGGRINRDQHAVILHQSRNGFHDQHKQHDDVDAGKNYISMETIQPADGSTNVAGSTNDLLSEEDSADTPNFNFHQHSGVAAASSLQHHHRGRHHSHHHRLPDDFGRSAGMKRFIIIIAALSAHSIFEGMALGVQSNRNLFVKLFVSILLHEVLMAMAIGLSLGEQRMTLKRKVLCSLLFSSIIPIGQVIGILMQKTTSLSSPADGDAVVSVAESAGGHRHGSDSLHATDNDAVSTTSAVVQALAVGTFLYVTFFEILPERMHRSDFSMIHVGFTIIGFLLIPVASILQARHY